LSTDKQIRMLVEFLICRGLPSFRESNCLAVGAQGFIRFCGYIRLLVLTLHRRPPGVGKTMTAEALSELLHKPLFTVSLAS